VSVRLCVCEWVVVQWAVSVIYIRHLSTTTHTHTHTQRVYMSLSKFLPCSSFPHCMYVCIYRGQGVFSGMGQATCTSHRISRYDSKWPVVCWCDTATPSRTIVFYLDISWGGGIHPQSVEFLQRPYVFPAVTIITHDFPTVNLVSYIKNIRQHHQMHSNWLKIEWDKNFYRATLWVSVVFAIVRCLSVHHSVCLSVTLVYCIQTAEDIVKLLSRSIAPSF